MSNQLSQHRARTGSAGRREGFAAGALRWALMTALCVAASGVAAQVKGTVASNLSVYRVVGTPQGKEALEPADSARPGDVLEYTVEYRNTTGAGVRKLEATLPIPQNTEYLPGSGKPAAAQASLDGTAFAPIPLTRTVRQADGKDLLQRVPYAEYRYLRWLPKDLAANDATRVSARVRLSADTAPSAAK